MNSLYIPPDFLDVYLPYLTKLQLVGHKEKLPIYEFSFQYFEIKANDTHAKYEEREKKSKLKALGTGDDFSSSDQFEILLPGFSYESCLILPTMCSFDSPSTEALSDPIIQDKEESKPTHIIHDISETSSISQDKLANVRQQKTDSTKVLMERITEFSHLMPEYLRAISGYLEFLDRGEPSEKLQILPRKVKSGTVQFEQKSGEDAFRDLINDSQTIDELNDVLKKKGVSCLSEFQERAICTEKEFVEIKTFETVETQTLVTGSWPCKHCSESSEVDIGFFEQSFTEGKLSPVAGLAKTSPNSKTFFKSSLQSVITNIKNSNLEPESHEGIRTSDIRLPLALNSDNKDCSEEQVEELITNTKLSSKGESKKDTSTEKSALIHCSHQSTTKLQLKIQNFSKSTGAKFASSNSRVSGIRTANCKDSRRDVSVSLNGRSWLRAYLTARMIKKSENEDPSSKLQTKHHLEDLGAPVLICRTYKTGPKHNFLSCNFLLAYNFLSSLRLWYFARKIREYEALDNQ